MSVAHVSRVFTGSRERYSGGIDASRFQGPVPAHLLEDDGPELELPVIRHPAPKASPFAAMSDAERREKAKRGAAARWKKQKTRFDCGDHPCPHCGGVTHSKGRGWRKCTECGGYHRPNSATPQIYAYSACPHCGKKSLRRNGRKRSKQVFRCNACGRTCRTDAGESREGESR